LQQGVFVVAMNVLNKYIKIAFADITDYAVFGKKEVEAMDMFGPLKDEEGNVIMAEVNYVDFNDSTHVDGTIITEVKKGKDGIPVTLADKMKALEMLSKSFDLLSENDKLKRLFLLYEIILKYHFAGERVYLILCFPVFCLSGTNHRMIFGSFVNSNLLELLFNIYI